MRALVLGGSVFVGKRLVQALLAGGHEVSVLNRGKTPTELPEGVGHLEADRTEIASMQAALGIQRVGRRVRRVGLRHGGRRQRHRRPARPVRRAGRRLRLRAARSWPTTSPSPGSSRGPRTCRSTRRAPPATGASRRSPSRRCSTVTRRRASRRSVVRPAAIYGPDNNIFDMETPMFLRLLQSRPILVPHGGLVATSYGHVDDLCEVMVAMAGQPAARGEIFNITAEGLTSARYVELLADIVGAEPDVVLDPRRRPPLHRTSGLRPPVRGPAPRHRQHRQGRAAARLPAPLRRQERSRRDVRVVPRAGLGRPDRAAARSGLGSELGLRGGGGAGREAAVTADERPVGRPSEGALWASVRRDRAEGRAPRTRRRPPHPPGRHPPRRAGHLRRAARARSDARPDRRAGRRARRCRPDR